MGYLWTASEIYAQISLEEETMHQKKIRIISDERIRLTIAKTAV